MTSADSIETLTSRSDFQATSDPAVSPGRGLLGYRELYELWERQQWATQDLDFAQDRIDWEGFDDEERFQRMSGLSAFFIGEQRVEAELGPLMRAVPDEDMRIFLSTQIADEARHVVFFDRFYTEVGILETDGIAARLEETSAHVTDDFFTPFDDVLKTTTDPIATEPEALEACVRFVTIYHMVIEGMLALTGQHFITDYNESVGTLPGFVEGFTNVSRDEHRHVAFGARFLREMTQRGYGETIQKTLAEVLPIAEGVLRPKWVPADTPDDAELFGATIAETKAFAAQALSRRMKVIGLIAA